MMGQSNGPALSVVFVDYDNIYLSLKRKNEEAARRFSKEAGGWLRGIETGRLITATQGMNFAGPRRIVLNRCYGNPAPRRNASDNSTDMNSFPFVRQNFLRAGFEVIDCPPLTGQLKNSADIKMVMDVLDYIKHQTYFDEFIVLSSDADFTPMLHRLRAHARRTVVYANDHTASAYTAISDGEVREQDLITLLMEGRVSSNAPASQLTEHATPGLTADPSASIMAEVVGTVRSAGQPVPLEALADRAIRVLGHDRTVGTNWGGAGTFRDLLTRGLPADLRMSDQPPYYIYVAGRELAAAAPQRRIEARPTAPAAAPYRPLAEPQQVRPAAPRAPVPQSPSATQAGRYASVPAPSAGQPPAAAPRAVAAPKAAPAQQPTESPAQIQQSIARIHAACKAPPLSPPDYRALFEGMAEELTVNGVNGAQTISNIAQRTLQHGAEIHRDDIQFVMEVVSEPDPWFEQGSSPILLANRFRNYVMAQCRRHGMALSGTEIDLIEMWFSGSAAIASPRSKSQPPSDANAWRAAQADPRLPDSRLPESRRPEPRQADPRLPMPSAAAASAQSPRGDRWWHHDEQGQPAGLDPEGQGESEEDFPRIVRSRLRT